MILQLDDNMLMLLRVVTIPNDDITYIFNAEVCLRCL